MSTSNEKRPRQEQPEKRRIHNPFLYAGTVVLLVITIIAFVFMPAGGGLSEGPELTLGSWDGKPISFVYGGYFAGQVQEVKAQYESQGYKDTGDQFFAYQVWRRAFENTVVHLALLDEARKAGIVVSEEQIDLSMLENPAFQENGAFSKRKYREASTTVKVALRNQIREQMLKERWATDSVWYIPNKAETEFLKALARDQRTVEYVAFPFSSYPEREKLAFVTANAALFRRVRLSRVMLTGSEAEAAQILDKVKTGSLSFEDAARNHSKDAYASKGGDMGQWYAWKLKGEFKNQADLDAVLALQAGAVSGVFETATGSRAFYRLDEAPAMPDTAPGSAASGELLASAGDYLNRYEKGRIEDWAVSQAKAFAASASTDFAASAVAAGHTVKTTAPFPLNYGKALDIGYFSLLGSLDTTDLPELEGADRNEKFLQTVFSLQPGAVSEPVIAAEYALVLRVKEATTVDDAELGLLEMYYPTVVQQTVSTELASAFLGDKRLEDNFMVAFSGMYSQSD